MNNIELVIAVDDEGERLDKVVVRRVPGIGRRLAAELFASGAVRVGQRIAKKGERARAGDRLSIELVASDAAEPEPDAELSIRLERPDLIVASKPAGQPTAALRGSTRGTLAGALLGRYPELASVGSAREPGLIHRLDTQTSGLVMVARTEQCFTTLKTALSAGQIDKRYLAIVASAGLPGSGVVDLPLAPHARDPRRVTTEPRDARGLAREALTEWQVVRRSGPWALVEARATPARRHQVRVHLAALGRPIANDTLYGGPEITALCARHALHASYVAWAGDATFGAFAVEDRLPADLAALL